MIFKPVLIHKITAGKKTMTRRPVKAGETEPRWTVGRAYAAQPGRGKPAAAHFIVTAVRVERLGELTFRDAVAEGFRSRDDFYAYWTDLYGHVDDRLRVWVISFRRDDRDVPRLLTANPCATRADYTSDPNKAARGEPEALTSAQFASLAHLSADHHRRLQVEPIIFHRDRIARELDAIREHLDNGIDDRGLNGAVSGLERQLASLDRRLGCA